MMLYLITLDILKAHKSLEDVLISHLVKLHDSHKSVLGIFLPSSTLRVLSIYCNTYEV